MSKRERTIYMIAGLLIGMIIMPIAVLFGIAAIGIAFLAACANSLLNLAEGVWFKLTGAPKPPRPEGVF